MPVNWLDVTDLSFNSLLLLERVQVSWFPGWLPEEETAIALRANPVVEWYLRHKCPQVTAWLNQIQSIYFPDPHPSAEIIRQAEMKVLRTINDLLVYVLDPGIYDAQPFLGWDSAELREITDFSGKTVLDIGSGTGRLAFIAAETAKVVFAVEPIGNLRSYIKEKTRQRGINNVFPVDGLITDIPFPPGFADITMGGHVFGDVPEAELNEMQRVTQKGGMIILCPGSSQGEEGRHQYLLSQGFSWSEFEEPSDGIKRKYWKTMIED